MVLVRKNVTIFFVEDYKLKPILWILDEVTKFVKEKSDIKRTCKLRLKKAILLNQMKGFI